MRRQLQSPFNERQYMLSKDFEIYYYNDNHFYGVTDHTHDYYEFYFFLEGNVTISIEKEHHHLKPGDMVFIPPGIHHHVSSVGETLPYQRFVFLDQSGLLSETERIVQRLCLSDRTCTEYPSFYLSL